MQQLFEEFTFLFLENIELTTIEVNEIYVLKRESREDLYEIEKVISINPLNEVPEFGPDNLGPQNIYGRTVVIPNLDPNFTNDGLIELMETNGYYPVNWEVLLQPDSTPTSIGVVEFETLENAYYCLENWSHPKYKLKHLINLSYPGPVGDNCSLNTVKENNWTKITPKKISYDPVTRKYIPRRKNNQKEREEEENNNFDE